MTEVSRDVTRTFGELDGVPCTACDWCRTVVAREDLVAHLESCETRTWAQHYGVSLNHPCICPECGSSYATNDEAYDCLATCYQKEGF